MHCHWSSASNSTSPELDTTRGLLPWGAGTVRLGMLGALSALENTSSTSGSEADEWGLRRGLSAADRHAVEAAWGAHVTDNDPESLRWAAVRRSRPL